MNRLTAFKILQEHFSLADIQGWMNDFSFVDRAALQVYKELVGKLPPESAPGDVVNITNGMTLGRQTSNLAYAWATEFVMAKLRYDNRPRQDLKTLGEGLKIFRELIKLHMVKDQPRSADEESAFQAQKQNLWIAAGKWYGQNDG